MFNDFEIRAELLKHIERLNSKHPYRLLEELAVCDGDARVDIAVANGKLHGYEIKSDRDTLVRLDKQVECYNRTFDTVTIVVGVKHVEKVREIIPEWWGIKAAFPTAKRGVKLKEIRRCKSNKAVEALALTQLLWREELRNLLIQHEVKKISGKNRQELRTIVASEISLDEIRDYTRNVLKTRGGWREDM